MSDISDDIAEVERSLTIIKRSYFIAGTLVGGLITLGGIAVATFLYLFWG
jgi:hypothetical protein